MNSAEKSLVELVRHVSRSEGPLAPLTYRELASRIGRINKHGEGHANGMGKVLEKMGKMLKGLADEWGDPVPHIQSLVVAGYGSRSGLPSDGIKEFWPGYPTLTRKEKENRAMVSYRQIRDYGARWNRVLQTLGLPSIVMGSDVPITTRTSFGSGGESAAHLALKNYVFENPEVVGASVHAQAFKEYPLPSLDVIDVLFKEPTRWLAIEVKSRVSDRMASDYDRGIYQCVKYRAILEAMRQDSDYSVPESIEVKLVLETKIPGRPKGLASSFQIQVVENVVPRSNLDPLNPGKIPLGRRDLSGPVCGGLEILPVPL